MPVWDCVSVISQTLCHFPTGTWKIDFCILEDTNGSLFGRTSVQPLGSRRPVNTGFIQSLRKPLGMTEGERQESRQKFFWLSMEGSLPVPWVRPKAEMDAQDRFCTPKAWSIIFLSSKSKDKTTKLVILVVLSEIMPSCYQHYFKRPLATKE